MKVLITGGAGRLGCEVAKICAHEGFSVRAFDLPQVNWAPLEAIDGVELFKGDITDEKNVQKACMGVDTVIHLAALLPPKTETNPDLTNRINVEGTRSLIQSMKHNTRIVFTSSIATYGVTAAETPPIKETHKQTAYSNYADSKIKSEKIVKASGLPYTVLRIAPISVADLLELPETVAYRSDQRIECIYVEDAAYALYACMRERENQVYNIGGGETWQMTGGEYIKRFYDALGVEVEPNYPKEYTAVDWYDTSRSRRLGYQRTNFNLFERKLIAIGEEMGLR